MLSKSIDVRVSFNILVSRSGVSGFSCLLIKKLSFLSYFLNQISIFLNHGLGVISTNLSEMGWSSVVQGVQWSQWKSLLQVLQSCSLFSFDVAWQCPEKQVVEDHQWTEQHKEGAWSDSEESSTGCFPSIRFYFTSRKHVYEDSNRWYRRELD